MKSFTTKGGQEFIILTRRKTEVKEFIKNLNYTKKDWESVYWDNDSTLFIEYLDGTTCYISETYYEGKVKFGKIKTLIYSDAWGNTVYGDYKIVNIDDTDEEYSPEVDSEDKLWSVA